MKYTLIASFFVCLLSVGIAFAHGENTPEVEAVLQSETITTADLGVQDPGTLPTSQWYFFKELGRGIQRLFTFNSIAKAELELRIANEKAAEAKKVEETKPDDAHAIQRAMENYEKAHERLQARLESLKETSQNPNVDRLLQRLAEQTVQHEKLFEELEEKHEMQKSIIQNIRARIAETAGAAAEKDTPEKFKARFEKVLEESKGSDFKHIRSIEILDRISRNASEDVREEIEELREEFSDEVQERLEALLDDEQETQRLREILEHLPGDLARRAVLLHEIRERVAAQRAKALDRILEELEETEEMKVDMKARAEEQIHHAQEKVEDLEGEISEIPQTMPLVVTTLLKKAQEHLQSAEKAFEEEKYGEALGQARSAEVTARNALRVIEEEFEEEEEEGAENFKEELEKLAREIVEAEAALELHDVTKEENARMLALFENAQEHLGFAENAFAKDDGEGTRLHIGHVKGFLHDFNQLLEGDTASPSRPEPVFCIQIYDPVCGVDGKTYSNVCVAEQQHNVRAAYKGECRPVPPPQELNIDDVLRLKDVVADFTIKADDTTLSPSEIRVAKGAKVKITFEVSETNVYFGGLDFRSSKFTTPKVAPGGSTTVEFTADESFEFTSYWPASNVRKATGRVIVE